jgi:hypothetical protein
MPARYDRDDERRCVVVTIQGAFEMDDIFAVIARLRGEDTWTYGVLYDLRDVTGHPSVEDLRAIVREATTRVQGGGRRGPVALVATGPIIFGRLCTYAVLARSPTLAIEVFRERSEAEEWLTATLTKSRL